MISLTRGQKVYEQEDLVVLDDSGDYNNNELIVCAKADSPDKPYCKLEAQYIAYGPIVYNISDEKTLLEEVKKIDPDNAFKELTEAKKEEEPEEEEPEEEEEEPETPEEPTPPTQPEEPTPPTEPEPPTEPPVVPPLEPNNPTNPDTPLEPTLDPVRDVRVLDEAAGAAIVQPEVSSARGNKRSFLSRLRSKPAPKTSGKRVSMRNTKRRRA